MNAMSRWEPARDFVTLREAMDRLFEDSFVGAQRNGGSGNGQHTPELRLPIEAYATENEIVVRAAVPGLKPENVEITIEGDTLTLRGEFPRPLENVSYIFAERPWGRFSRTLQLNVPVQPDKAEATFENGLLTLALPKAEAVRPKTIQIKAK
jgi:HSP20 family protein